MKYGYARVSTRGQTLDIQLIALKAEICERIFQEKASGAERSRPQLSKVLDALTSGDVLIITRLDRLARSTRDLLDMVATIEAKGAALKSIAEPWADTTTPAGKMMLTVLSGLAEFERGLILERTSEGRALAKARGKRFGRPPALSAHQQKEVFILLDQGKNASEIARLLGVSHSTISRLRSRK